MKRKTCCVPNIRTVFFLYRTKEAKPTAQHTAIIASRTATNAVIAGHSSRNVGHLTRKPYGCFGSPVKQNKRCSFVACFSAMRDLMFVYYSWSQINWYSTLFGQVRDPSPAISRAGVARYARSPAVPSDRGLGHGRAQRWARGGQFPAAGLGSVRRVACDRRRRRPGRVALIILPFVAVDRHGPEIRWPYHGESPKNKTREPFFTFPPTNPLQSSDERRPPPLTSWL